MQISYRIELEKAAHRMILIHRTDILIKLIIRTVIRNLKVAHAGIFLYDQNRESFVLTISRGEKGIKIPGGLIKITPASPLVKYFSDKKHNIWDDRFLLEERILDVLHNGRLKDDVDVFSFLERVHYQMVMYKTKAALPITFREDLLGIVILGEKNDCSSFQPEELTFLSILSSDVAMALRNATLFEDLRVQLDRNQELFLQTITALAQAIEAKDTYTMGHTQRVSEYSLQICEHLRKTKRIPHWDQFEKDLKIAALLHDIGKIGVPEQVLNKIDPLTDQEFELIKKHPIIGEEILAPIKELKDVIGAVRSHHERYDGSGYPEGLSGAKIPLLAAVISVADAFDAMTSDRSYRKAFPAYKAVEIIKEEKGKQFNPQVVDAFLAFYEEASTVQEL